jgi:uncharacterized protein (DUF2267 family)
MPCAIGSRLEEAVQFGAQLPMLIGGFYYEGWTLEGKPHKERHKRDFLDHIKKAFKNDVTVNPQQICRAVFRVLVRLRVQAKLKT